jgi:RND family efflux transporter MFP subunit
MVLYSCKKEEKPLPNSKDELKLEKEKIGKLKDSLTQLEIKIDEKLAKYDTVKKLQPVSVIKIKSTDYKHYISIQGNSMTDKNVMVRPQANGLITRVYVKEGQYVKSGQTLFQLDDAILRNSISEVENHLILATTTFERQQRLWNQKIGSEMQYLQTKNQKEALENNIRTLKSQLNNYKVKAPFSGIIDDLIATKGDLASAQTALAQLINLNNMYVESDVSENFLKSIKKGNNAILNFTSLGEEINAKVSRVGNNISQENRSFKVRINVKNRKKLIKPNLLADIKINDLSVKDAIVIPSKLIQTDENGDTFVFITVIKDSTNIVTKKLITVESSYQGKSLIAEGLNETDLLIDEGSRNISNKQEVTIQ